MGKSGGTLALVESPAQLLNVVEWAAAHDVAEGLPVIVLAPKDAGSVRQLEAVADAVRSSGVQVDLQHVRAGALAMVRGGASLMRRLARVDRLVVGDPFSGLIQSMLPVVTAREFVVVDDGTATWQFASCVAQGQPLVRWNVASTRSRLGAYATRAFTPRADRSLAVFTSMRDAVPPGAVEEVNSYGWTRRLAVPQVQLGETLLVGTSLAATGVVEPGAYVEAVVALAERTGARQYYAHRREQDALLDEIAARAGVQTRRSVLPIELALRLGPVPQNIVTFPSTAAHTLPIVLSDTAVRVQVLAPEPGWFTESSTPHARRFVQRIATGAPAQRMLSAA